MARAPGLERLITLYSLVERVRAVELQVAESTVDGVKRSQSAEVLIQRGLIREGRSALLDGDRAEWMLALRGRSFTEARLQHLLEEKLTCEDTREKAAQAHRMSRLQLQQVQRVIERARMASAIVQVRRSQALADDRYGSRREWKHTETVSEI